MVITKAKNKIKIISNNMEQQCFDTPKTTSFHQTVANSVTLPHIDSLTINSWPQTSVAAPLPQHNETGTNHNTW